jgi:hypothetical protein
MKENLLLKILGFVIFTLLFSCKPDNLPEVTIKRSLKSEIEITNNREYQPTLDTTSQTILLIGDSMAHFLKSRMNDYCEENNHTFYTVSWVSANTKWFAESDTIFYFINEYSPTYIFFVIGSNKVNVNDTSELHKNILKIEEKFTGIKSIWIGPPNWGGSSKIDDIILSVLGENKFFSSQKLKFTSKAEGDLHPSVASSEMWMDSIASWILKKSDYPIKMDLPKVRSKKEINALVLKPLY